MSDPGDTTLYPDPDPNEPEVFDTSGLDADELDELDLVVLDGGSDVPDPLIPEGSEADFITPTGSGGEPGAGIEDDTSVDAELDDADPASEEPADPEHDTTAEGGASDEEAPHGDDA